MSLELVLVMYLSSFQAPIIERKVSEAAIELVDDCNSRNLERTIAIGASGNIYELGSFEESKTESKIQDGKVVSPFNLESFKKIKESKLSIIHCHPSGYLKIPSEKDINNSVLAYAEYHVGNPDGELEFLVSSVSKNGYDLITYSLNEEMKKKIRESNLQDGTYSQKILRSLKLLTLVFTASLDYLNGIEKIGTKFNQSSSMVLGSVKLERKIYSNNSK